MLVVGDSLTVGCAPYLQADCSGQGCSVTVDATAGRHTRTGVDGLRGRALPGRIVLALGTNDAGMSQAAFAGLIERAIGLCGERDLLWVNVDTGTPRLAVGRGVNAAIAAAASRHRRLTLCDWAGYLRGRPDRARLRHTDGVHLTAAGYRVRSAWLADRIRWAPQPGPR